MQSDGTRDRRDARRRRARSPRRSSSTSAARTPALINELAGVTGDMRIGHRPLRQEVFAVPAPPGFALEDGGPFVADLDIGQYFRPQAGGTLLVGGTEPECDELEWVDDPDHFDEHTDRRALGDVRCCASPGGCRSSACPTQPVGLAALYDASDDWVPIYDRSSLHGYFMACGTSGNQFKNAPLAGPVHAGARRRRRRRPRPRRRARAVPPAPLTGRTIDLGARSPVGRDPDRSHRPATRDRR